MCNLYSITTNQAAIIALFRVMNRYVGNVPPMPGVFPDYPAPVAATRRRAPADDDALGHAATAEFRRAARNQHSRPMSSYVRESTIEVERAALEKRSQAEDARWEK
jgi:hypothetical protein